MLDLPRPTGIRPSLAGILDLARRSRGRGSSPRSGLALWIGTTLEQARADADEARRHWSDTVDVRVATGPLPAGTVVGAGAAERRGSAAAVPADPSTEDPTGAVLRDDVGAGEILRTGRLASGSASALERLPAGRGGLRLSTKLLISTWATRSTSTALLTGERVAIRAPVVSLDESIPTVALTAEELPRVVAALTAGDVVAVVVG
ncbi:MAG: hypothetical protein R2695_10710 [Acidimicrobiales bacterium]